MNEIIKQEIPLEVSNSLTIVENFRELKALGDAFAGSKMIPSNYQGKPMDCIIAIDMANRMDVSPLFVMQNLYVVQGKPSWSGQACMSLIKASKDFKGAKPVYTGPPGSDSWGCSVHALEASTGKLVIGPTVTIKMAKEEKWLERPGSKWKTMPELMLAYRAAAFFARIYLPNALMGIHVEGEAEDISKTVTPPPENPFTVDAEVVE